MKYYNKGCGAPKDDGYWAGEDSRRWGGRTLGGRTLRQHREDVLEDLRTFHPFSGRVPGTDEEIAEEIGALLTVLAVRTHVPRARRAKPPVTLRMRHALRKLARVGGALTVTRLAVEVGTGVAAASQLVGRMGARGLVEKERGRDRRTRNVVLTEWGWRHVPRDEPEDELAGLGLEWEWDERPRASAPPKVERAEQPPSAIDEGLRCRAIRVRAVRSGLRGVLATIHGFDFELWAAEFQFAVEARLRWPRDRWQERWTLAGVLPRPRLQV